jgi:uncharacterized protein (TIGR02594 family)
MSNAIRAIQNGLTELGYLGPNLSDGVWGPKTEAATKEMIQNHGAYKEFIVSSGDLPWISQMKSVFGLHEARDKARLQTWLKSDGHTLGSPTDWPWCGDAVETAVKLALPNEPFVGALAANPYWARNWTSFGRAAKGYGSIAVFERGPNSGHVGFLVGEDSACYHVLGGNQSDTVSVTRILKTRLLAARWPITWQNDPAPLPVKAPTQTVSVNEV